MLKVNREILLEALSIVNHAVAKKASMPVLTHIRLSMDRNSGTVTGTDLENTIVFPIEGNCAKKVDILLPAKKLHEILKNAQSNEQDVNIDINNGKASVNHAEINTLPAEEYPVLPEIGKSVKLELRDFEPVMKKAIVAAGEHDTRYMLNSVLLDFKNNAVIATDGHRLHKTDFKFGIDHPQVIMPIATAKLIRGEVIKARIDSTFGVFENGRYTVFCRFMDGTYPDWQRVIPEKSTVKITINRRELIELAQESVPMVRERANAGRITVTGDSLCIESINPELGFNKSAIKAECKGSTEFVFGINLGYLLDTLRQLKNDTVTLQMTDALAPIKIIEKGFLALVMPMRVEG